jgi:hypothetical protein
MFRYSPLVGAGGDESNELPETEATQSKAATAQRGYRS